MSKKIVIVAVALSGWLVAGLLLVGDNREPLTGVAGTMGGSKTNRAGGKTVSSDQVFALNSGSLKVGDIGLLNLDAETLTLKRTKDTPQKVKVDVDYSFYLSVCDDQPQDMGQDDGHTACASYVRTDRVLPGGTRVSLDFSKAAPLAGDASETITLQLSTLEDERLHTYAKIASDTGNYRVKGDGTSIGFVAIQ